MELKEITRVYYKKSPNYNVDLFTDDQISYLFATPYNYPKYNLERTATVFP